MPEQKKNPGPPLTSETKGSLDAVPAEFRAKVGTKTVKRQNPTDIEPTTPSGKLIESKVEQTRTDEREKSDVSLVGDVATELVSEVMLQTGQVGTQTRKLVDEGTPLVVDEKTDRAEQRNLGNGKLDQTVVQAPEVFKAGSYETVIPDVVPQEFQVGIPTTVNEETSAGQVDTTPDLATGDLSRRESQVGEFLKRIRLVTRATVTLPKVLLEHFRGGISGEGSDFTGNVTRTRTLDNGQQEIDSGFLILDSRSKNLGNGQSVKETETVAGFSTLIDNVLDPRFGVIRNRTKSIVATGTPCPAGSSQFAKDTDRSIRVTETIDSTSLGAISWRFPGTTNVDLPPELISISAFSSTSAGAGGYSETGSYGLSSNGSGGIQLRGHAQGSASALINVTYNVKQPWGSNKPCTNILFFANATDSRGTLLGRAGSILGGGISDWPKFVPVGIVVSMIGGKQTLGLELSATAHDVVVAKYDGSIVRAGSSRTSGGGISTDVGTSTEAVRIPPTIHGSISVGGNTTVTSSFASNSSISTGANGATGTLSGSSSASVLTTSFPATPGQSTIPSSGNYAHRIVVEPYIPGVVMVHIEVVNFADLN